MDQPAARPTTHLANLGFAGKLPSAWALVPAIVLSAAAVLAATVIAASGLEVKLSEFAPFVALAAGMGLVAAYARFRKMEPRFAQAAALVGAGTLSLLTCGLISNVGLRLRAPTIDAALARIDEIIGWDVSVAVPAFTAHPWLIDGLAFVYNLSGPLAAGTIVLTLLSGRTDKAWELFNTTVMTMQVIAAISIMAPARGAMAHFDLLYLQGNGLPKGAGVYHLAAFDHLHAGTDLHFGLADMSGLVTFPSFHTVLGLLLAQALAETRLAWLGVAASSAVIVSTIPIGGHYVTDILAGTLIWLIAAAISRRISSPSGS